jgi:hypothetical protein
MMVMVEHKKHNEVRRNSNGEAGGAKKRGRKPLGGVRIILRLTPEEVQVLAEKQKQLGLSRTDLIRRAIGATYSAKRRETDWTEKK